MDKKNQECDPSFWIISFMNSISTSTAMQLVQFNLKLMLFLTSHWKMFIYVLYINIKAKTLQPKGTFSMLKKYLIQYQVLYRCNTFSQEY